MIRAWVAAALALAAAALAPAPARADAPTPAAGGALVDRCAARVCEVRLTPRQLLGEVQILIDQGRYAEAKPLLAALAEAPGLKLEYRFLSGFLAQKDGDLDGAADFYKAILSDDPRQTRVRLELARVMLLQGKRQSADRQFRIAEEDGDLPPEIAGTIRAARTAIRGAKAWRLNIDAGLAPDTNINNATSVDSINYYLGGQVIGSGTLSDDARARSGIGRTASIDAGLRLPTWGESMLLVDATAIGTDYDGRQFDDYAFEAAVGPEVPLNPATQVRAQVVASERLYGGRVATRQLGLKGGAETLLSRTGRLGVQIDARRTYAAFDPGFSGWQLGLYATYERAVAKAVVASGGVFVRRDALKLAPFSNKEAGVIAGIGGELPHGINLAVSGTASRARYDEAFVFGPKPRDDWRYSLRGTLGLRSVRVAGFSPSVSASFSRIDSNIDLYAATRTRFRFALARYF